MGLNAYCKGKQNATCLKYEAELPLSGGLAFLLRFFNTPRPLAVGSFISAKGKCTGKLK